MTSKQHPSWKIPNWTQHVRRVQRVFKLTCKGVIFKKILLNSDCREMPPRGQGHDCRFSYIVVFLDENKFNLDVPGLGALE